MSNTALLWIVTAIYFGQAIICLVNKQPAQALIVGGYVVANIGLALSMG